MIAWFRRFLFDETAFVGLVRAVCLSLGTAVATGMIDVAALGLPDWVGIGLLAVGGFVRSSSHTAAAKNGGPK